jgi:hypothetical protein
MSRAADRNRLGRSGVRLPLTPRRERQLQKVWTRAADRGREREAVLQLVCAGARGCETQTSREDDGVMNRPSMFSQAQLDAIVKQTLPEIPAGHKEAIVGGVDEHGVQVVASLTFKQEWTVEAAYQHEWAGDDKIGAKVMWSR